MSGAKYTKGPWVFEAEEGFCSMIISEDGDIACQFDQDPKEADARLMAAAPELLEALQEAVACGMVPTSTAMDGGACAHSRQVRCADMIRAAIAKVLGQADV